MRERKRHTARRVASAPYVAVSWWWGGGYLIQSWRVLDGEGRYCPTHLDLRRGYPHPHLDPGRSAPPPTWTWEGGTSHLDLGRVTPCPHPHLDLRRGYPLSPTWTWEGGTPTWTWEGVPLTPTPILHLDLRRGYPLSPPGPEKGVPPPGPGKGTPYPHPHPPPGPEEESTPVPMPWPGKGYPTVAPTLTWEGVPPCIPLPPEPEKGVPPPPCLGLWRGYSQPPLDLGRGTPPPRRCEQIDTCKNSTFPRTTYAGGKNSGNGAFQL